MEKLEDLQVGGLKIYQDDSLYTFTSDSVLLAKFTRVKKHEAVADFCAGCGIVGFYLYGLNKDKIDSLTFFEMQKPLYDLAQKSIKLNGLEQKVNAFNVKLQQLDKSYAGKFSLVTVNPPYMSVDRGFSDSNDSVALCRTEKSLSLKELIYAVSMALKFGGRVNLVHRADRLCEVITELKERNIEPKRIQFVSGGAKEPYLFLMEGVKGGKTGVKILPTINN